MKKLEIIISMVLLGTGLTLYAQQSINASGGEATGNGQASFSVGQVTYTALSEEGEGSLIQGVQIPYEVYSSLGSIFGNVSQLVDCHERDITIELYSEGAVLSSSFVLSLDADGEFLTTEFPAGSYDILITVEGYLSKLFLDVVIESGINVFNVTDIIAGDLDGSNGVNVIDVSFLSAAFGASDTDENYNFLADFNCDGYVNIVDVSLLNLTFGMVGDNPPEE